MNEPRDTDRRAGRAWLADAHGELQTARLIAREQGDFLRPSCFHAHLAAEKAFKAVLVVSAAEFHKTHDLFRLLDLVRQTPFAVDIDEAVDPSDVRALSGWELEGRYPEDLVEPTSGDVALLLEAAGRILAAVDSVLTPFVLDTDG